MSLCSCEAKIKKLSIQFNIKDKFSHLNYKAWVRSVNDDQFAAVPEAHRSCAVDDGAGGTNRQSQHDSFENACVLGQIQTFAIPVTRK